MFLNCGVGEDYWESLDSKEIQPVHPKGNKSWIFIGRTDTEAETPILWPPLTLQKRHWCLKRLKAGGEGDDRGWDGLMASPIWWTWVWASLGSWWWTGKPGMLQCPWVCRVKHDWGLNWLLPAEKINKWNIPHFSLCDVQSTEQQSLSVIHAININK